MVVVACCFCLSLAYRLVRRILAVEDPQFILDSVAVIFAAFTAFVSTVIAVPMAITKFLFNTKEDDNITQLINHTQEHDAAGIDKLKDKFSKKLPGKAGGNKPKVKNPNQANPKSNRTRPEYRSHTGPPAQTEKPVCTASPLCEGCPFPGHGFLCQGEDGECMRTRLMKLSEKEEPK